MLKNQNGRDEALLLSFGLSVLIRAYCNEILTSTSSTYHVYCRKDPELTPLTSLAIGLVNKGCGASGPGGTFTLETYQWIYAKENPPY